VFFAGWISDPTYNQLALYLIPVASITITKVFFWMQLFGGREARIKIQRFKLNRGKQHASGILENPNSSDKLKREARAKIEALELALLNLMVEDLLDPPK